METTTHHKAQPLVSIIVPIYNTEKYLNQCLDSISNQSYKNIEIILINDGSTDASLHIALDFSRRDKRAKLISQANSGVAAARNNGVTQATGAYIIHADSDDELPTDAIESLCSSALESNADIVIADYIIQTKNNSNIQQLKFTGDKHSLLLGILEGRYHASLWNKLVRRSLYSEIPFTPGLDVTEDKLFICRLLSNPDPIKIKYINRPIYVYKKRTGSYTTNPTEKSILDQITVNELLHKELRGIIDEKALSHLENHTETLRIINIESHSTNAHKLKSILIDTKIPLTRKIMTWLAANNIRLPIKIGKIIKYKLLHLLN